MSIFRTRTGEERWTCFSTGESGSAIDLVMTARGCDVRSAIEWLAERSGLGPVRGSSVEPTMRGPRTVHPRTVMAGEEDLRPTRVHPRVEAYVTTCERLLWGNTGAAARAWLTCERGFAEDVLRANRVGFDPGPDGFARPKGLPRLGPAVVLPALNDQGRSLFFQARYLDPDEAGRKYDNPPMWLASNPKITPVRLGDAPRAGDNRVVVTEGIPDALAAATAGCAAFAILGTANTSVSVARPLADVDATLVLAFDADDAGRAGSARLIESLAALGRTDRVAVLCPPAKWGDLNAWLCADPANALTALGRPALGVRRPPATPSISMV